MKAGQLQSIENIDIAKIKRVARQIKTDDRIVYEQAKEIIMKYNTASASFLQRKLKIGYARAARILDMLEVAGHVGAQKGSYARQVLKK